MNFTDRNAEYSQKIIDVLKEKIPGIRIDYDFRQTTIPAKVKEAENEKIPFILVIGDNEEKNKTLAVRIRGDSKIKNFRIDEFVEMFKKEIDIKI